MRRCTTSRSIVVLLMAVACTACRAGAADEAPACNTPELREVFAILIGEDERLRGDLMISIQSVAPASIAAPRQRCYVESFLATPSIAEDSNFELEAEFGVLPFFCFDQPDYLGRMVERHPSSLLVWVHGRPAVTPLLEWMPRNRGFEFFRSSHVGAMESVLRRADAGEITLSDAERNRAMEILEQWARDHERERQAGRQPSPLPFNSIWFNWQLGPPEAKEHLIANLGSSLEFAPDRFWQILQVEDLARLGRPEARVLAAAFLEQEQDPVVRDYLDRLGEHLGGDPVPERPTDLFSRASEDCSDRALHPRRYSVPSLGGE